MPFRYKAYIGDRLLESHWAGVIICVAYIVWLGAAASFLIVIFMIKLAAKLFLILSNSSIFFYVVNFCRMLVFCLVPIGLSFPEKFIGRGAFLFDSHLFVGWCWLKKETKNGERWKNPSRCFKESIHSTSQFSYIFINIQS